MSDEPVHMSASLAYHPVPGGATFIRSVGLCGALWVYDKSRKGQVLATNPNRITCAKCLRIMNRDKAH